MTLGMQDTLHALADSTHQLWNFLTAEQQKNHKSDDNNLACTQVAEKH